MKRRMRFGTWCEKDINDNRKINYTFETKEGVKHFTSDDNVPSFYLVRLIYAWIRSIELIDNEWHVVLYED